MKYYNLHTHHYSNQSDVLEIVNQYPKDFDASIPFYSTGIHPWKIEESSIFSDLKIIESKLSKNNCLALGECGLDKRIATPLNLQIDVFEKQLHLAEKNNKPVVIHCVGAFQEVIEIKKKLQISVPMIIHGFSKSEALAKQLIANDFYLSFGKYLLRIPELESVFNWIPNHLFFLETDTIEEDIKAVYQMAAKYKKSNLETLLQIVEENFDTVFKLNLKK